MFDKGAEMLKVHSVNANEQHLSNLRNSSAFFTPFLCRGIDFTLYNPLFIQSIMPKINYVLLWDISHTALSPLLPLLRNA